MFETEEIKEFLQRHYPYEENSELAQKLGMSEHKVRRFATKWGIRKSKEFIEKKMQITKQAQKEYFEKRLTPLHPTLEQLSIIFGSLLGDATLSCGPRSKHFAYKEHFSEKQREYRLWKQQKLANLGFHITKSHHLYSYSHPFFTELYSHFFRRGKKVIPSSLLPQMTHPLFLATLYMDDGSLLITTRQTNSSIFIHPSIVIYSQCFTKEENELLRKHLNETFGTNFVLTSRPDGHGYILKVNKEHEVRHLLQIIQPFAVEVPSMFYKTSLEERMAQETEKWRKRQPGLTVIPSSSQNQKPYSKEEIQRIIELRQNGTSLPMIASVLNRPYWSVVYKVEQLGLTKTKKHPDR